MVRMLEFLKKIFFALLPFLQKAAEEALNEATSSQGSEGLHNSKGEERRASSQSSSKPSAPKPSASTRSASTASASAGSDYPGDYRDMINFEYSPSLDGDADPGEIVWTWVPFEEDHSQGKDFWWVVTVSTCWR